MSQMWRGHVDRGGWDAQSSEEWIIDFMDLNYTVLHPKPVARAQPPLVQHRTDSVQNPSSAHDRLELLGPVFSLHQ